VSGQLVAAMAQQFEAWGDVPVVVRAVFGDASAEEVAAAIDSFCALSLGSHVEGMEFFRASVGSVHGLRLDDGRRVVVKVARPGTDAARLESVQTVERWLAADGFPCPLPLAGPVPLGRGLATAETLLDRGEAADAHEPALRRTMAAALAGLTARCGRFTALDALRATPQVGLWPRPHDGRFDFEATGAGAEWLDALAGEAQRILDAGAGDLVVGHGDWRAENMRFSAGEISAVYDWDSLVILREPRLVGGAAHHFTGDYSRPGRRQLPTLEEALAFIAEYEAARGTPFSAAERRVARAALVYGMAYTARCSHSDLLTDFGRHPPALPQSLEPRPGSAAAFLAAHAAELLRA
jgi:hypothetical protein